jgi:hypothetical protein
MTMSWRCIRALLRKDFRIHGRDIVLTQTGILVLLALMTYLQPREAAVSAAAVFGFNFILSGFWSDWLVTREKTKGTFAWLRATPVADSELVLSKFIAVGACCVTLWGISSAMFIGPYLFPSRWAVWLVLQMALLAFALLATATRFRFGQKLGQMLPFAIVFVFVTLLNVADRAGLALSVDPELLLGSDRGQALLVVALVICCVSSFGLTLTWVRSSDTARLLE